jgi:hypothetical protein
MGLTAATPILQDDDAESFEASPAASAPAFKPTDEQSEIIDLALAGYSVSVSAFAGAGKTSTQKAVSDAILQKNPGRSIHYFAFNRAMADEARTKFPGRVRVSTAHSLAYNARVDGVDLGRTFRPRMKSGKELRDAVTARHKKAVDPVREFIANEYSALSDVLETVRNFCYSNDTEVLASHAPYDHTSIIAGTIGKKAARGYVQAVSAAAAKVWKDMSSLQGDFPATHDVYLKLWALRGNFSEFDMVLFDEAQDANPVMISALQKMQDNGAQIILVGDPHQSIYGWRGAVDAMSAFPDFKQAYLTESFRFGQNIADAAQLFLIAGGETRQLKWRNPNPGIHRDGPVDRQDPFPADAILCRSNAGVIFTSLAYINDGKKPYVEGGAQEAAKLLTALRELHNTKGGREAKYRPRHPEIALFETWEDLEQYSESKEGGSFKPYVGITKRMIAQGTMDASIQSLQNGTAESRGSADVTVSTVHKAKGLEWHNVHMGSDWEKTQLHIEHTYADDVGQEEHAYSVNPENYKLLYVAWTRAQSGLETSGWHGIYEQQAHAIREKPLTPDIARRIENGDRDNVKPHALNTMEN